MDYYDDFDDGQDFEDDAYEYEYDRVIEDSDDFYSYDDEQFDYTEVEKAEMRQWEQWYAQVNS